jgi:hypothetical protein
MQNRDVTKEFENSVMQNATPNSPGSRTAERRPGIAVRELEQHLSAAESALLLGALLALAASMASFITL